MCGNFGLVLANEDKARHVIAILEKMVQVTMMRGAQCGGVVTYIKGGKLGLRGKRGRVVNGKRSNLSVLVSKKVAALEKWVSIANYMRRGHGLVRPSREHARLYCGHTRFATTSKVTFEGTHPHQWSPPRVHEVYVGDWTTLGGLKKTKRNFELFVLHNGDFDAWEVAGTSHDLGIIQSWVARATESPMPCTVDSCAIAGVMDLLRAQGSWFHALRLAFCVNGGLSNTSNGLEAMWIPRMVEFELLAREVEKAFDSEVARLLETPADAKEPLHAHDSHAHNRLVGPGMRLLRQGLPKRLESIVASALTKWVGSSSSDGDPSSPGRDLTFASSAVGNFFDNDLLQSTRTFLAGATGSFGLCVNSSLDSDRQVALAARGQTISVAFYPKFGMVVWGSEAAATKAPLAIVGTADKTFTETCKISDIENACGTNGVLEPATRLDLDDLGGEICLLDWGGGGGRASGKKSPPTLSSHANQLQQVPMMNASMSITLAQESLAKFGSFKARLINLEGDERVLPLPTTVASDPVGKDIRDIPAVLRTIQEEWQQGGCMNRVTAHYFGQDINNRMHDVYDNHHRSGHTSSHRVDLLITGCETSLWVGEQFASDLNQVFPNMKVKCLSSNKILGLKGQSQSLPQTGFEFNEETYDLHDTVVLILSHSGGTFAPLAVANLLQSETDKIYVVTSEWDTQVGKQLRQIGSSPDGKWTIDNMKSRIFSTDVGIRPSEPCTISVVAIHQVLTQIIIFLMGTVVEKDRMAINRGEKGICSRYGATFTRTDVAQLQALNENTVRGLEEITEAPSTTNAHLVKVGRAWGLHVIEAPIVWIACAVYIIATVGLGVPPLVTAIAESLPPSCCESFLENRYGVGILDGLVYLFFPQIFTVLLRVVQGRPVLHRMVGRSVVIGDTPMVAQVAEAMASKLFACSFSNTGVQFCSGNPTDHLVHRFTHRVVRGSLLIAGRPDGRLCGLTSAEAATCLSVNQASSIQNMGATCESITVGHNPSQLPLTKDAVVLPSASRPEFLCERALRELVDSKYDGLGLSANALLGSYENLWARSAQALKDVDQLDKVKEKSGYDFSHPDGAKAVVRQLSSQTHELIALSTKPGDVKASQEEYFGEALLDKLTKKGSTTSVLAKLPAAVGVPVHALLEQQRAVMRLYESRFASLERLVSYFVLFHAMGKRVQDFWPFVSMGFLRYDMDRTHSIMRIATTASPVSGASIREQMKTMALQAQWKQAKKKLLSLVKIRRSNRAQSARAERPSYEG